MRQLIFSTGGDWPGLIARLTLFIVMLPHGAQKVFGVLGGYGFKATMTFFTNTMRLPWIVSLLIIVIEFIGPIGLLLGIASRIWAVSFIVVMIGAIYTTNLKNGFFMNWFGNQAGEGYEYHLLIIGISVALLINGSGRFSIDSLIMK